MASHDEAESSLGAVAESRRIMAARLRAPWWYRVGAALCTASLFVGAGLLSNAAVGNEAVAHGFVVLGAVLGPLLLLSALKRATGVSVDRYARGLGPWYVVVFGLFVLGIAAHVILGVPHVLFGGALVAFVATLLSERHVDRLLGHRVLAGAS